MATGNSGRNISEFHREHTLVIEEAFQRCPR
jgi:hypothetical protein